MLFTNLDTGSRDKIQAVGRQADTCFGQFIHMSVNDIGLYSSGNASIFDCQRNCNVVYHAEICSCIATDTSSQIDEVLANE